MTMTSETAAYVEDKAAQFRRATASYIAGLARIADVSTLTTGAHGCDYAIVVPQNEKLALLPLLADLTMAIEDEFGVKITTLPDAGPNRP